MTAAVLTTTPAQAQIKQQAIDVRIGQHKDMSRMVFDFPVLTGYKAEIVDGEILLTFTTPHILRFPKTRTREVRDIWSAKLNPQTVQVKITVPRDAKYQHYRLMRRIVVDIHAGKPVVAAGPKTVTKAPPQAVPQRPPAKTDAAPPAKAADKTTPDQTQPSQTPAMTDDDLKITAVIPDMEQEDLQRTVGAPLQEKTGDTHVLVDVPPPEDNLPYSDQALRAARGDTADTAAVTDTTPTRIVLSTIEPTRLAVFTRFNTLWIVMDAATAGSQKPAVNGPLADVLGQPEMTSFNGGVAYRYHLPPRSYISANRRNLSWDITLSSSPLQAPSTNTLNAEYDAASKQSKLIIPLKGAGRVLKVPDPDTGDDIYVLTTTAPAERIDQARKFPNVQILPAASGLAIVPYADDIRINRIQDFVLVSAPSGIIATPHAYVGSALSDNSTTDAGAAQAPRLFNFPGWRQGGLLHLNRNRRQIERQIAAASTPEARNDLLIKLALLYFANSFGHETLGVLRVVVDENPTLSTNPNFLALRGAAAAMAGHYRDALQDLSSPAIQQHPEVNLWTGYVAAATEQWQRANRSFPRDTTILAEYPEEIRIPVTVYMAESALRLGRSDSARKLLDGLTSYIRDTTPQHFRAAIAYLRGEIARQEGRTGDAIRTWLPIAHGIDRLYHAKAALALANLELQENRITIQQAVDRVDSLRFAWRGDGLEVQILHNLGLLRIRNGQHLAGLQDLKAAAQLAETLLDDPEPIRQDINRAFNNIFPGGDAVNVPPLEAVSIYNEFRDQIPPGDAGSNAMIKVADYMITIDLLEKAAQILSEQIFNGYLPAARIAETGAKLAVVYLLDGKPEQAIAALDKTGGNNPMTERIAQERDLIRARALSRMNRTHQAADILGALNTPDAQKLKADIFWRARQWQEAAEAIVEILPAPADAISEEDATLVINAAVAYKLAGDDDSLREIRGRYARAMQNTSRATTFSIVTRTGGGSTLSDRNSILHIANEVDMFQSFLDSYKSAGN